MASCIIKSASSSSGSEALIDNKYPDLPDGSINILTELFPSSPIDAQDQFMAEDYEPSHESILFHQITILAGIYAFLDLPGIFDTDRRAALVAFIESHQEAIKKAHSFAGKNEFTEMQVKKAKCISCALLVQLNGLHPERINEPGFMDQISELLSSDDMHTDFSYYDRISLELKLTEIICSQDHGQLVEFVESCPIGILHSVFIMLKDFFLPFAMSHHNTQSLQYLINILSINDKDLFMIIADRSENQEIKDFFYSKLN